MTELTRAEAIEQANAILAQSDMTFSCASARKIMQALLSSSIDGPLRYPSSDDIGVYVMPNGDRWAISGTVARDIQRKTEADPELIIEACARECERLRAAAASETTVGESMSYTECAHAIRALKTRMPSADQLDAARLDFLAEITNLDALHNAGAMLTAEQHRLWSQAVEAMQQRYELHRRTKNTPDAFRLAVDDARSAGAP